jgi:hypothetical protein
MTTERTTIELFARSLGRHSCMGTRDDGHWLWYVLRQYMPQRKLPELSEQLQALLRDTSDDARLITIFRDEYDGLEGIAVKPREMRQLLVDTLELIPAVLRLPAGPWMTDPNWTLEPRPRLARERALEERGAG